MKKLIVMIAALLAALLIAGCASKPPAGPSASELMASAANNVPPGVLVGQATATAGKDKDAAAKKAESNARFQLVRAMSFIAKDLVDDAVSAGKLTSSVAEPFYQSITVALGRSTFRDVVKVDSGFGAGDTAWAVYYLDKANVLKELNQAVNAAKELHAAGPFNTNGFDAKYSIYSAREWKS
jgi:hypothetical protein